MLARVLGEGQKVGAILCWKEPCIIWTSIMDVLGDIPNARKLEVKMTYAVWSPRLGTVNGGIERNIIAV